MHTGFAPIAYHEPTQLAQTQQIQPNKIQLIVWKVHVSHDHEHGYNDSLDSADVAQLYPQVGDFIAS
jgi:hypothetical protein